MVLTNLMDLLNLRNFENYIVLTNLMNLVNLIKFGNSDGFCKFDEFSIMGAFFTIWPI